MQIIIGLGNPGEKYINTRHNVGFMFLDTIKKDFSFPEFEFNKKFNAAISVSSNSLLLYSGEACLSGRQGGRRPDEGKIILLKPQTFMNNSGQSVQAILDFYKLTPENILVVHDDLDIELGKYKLVEDSRAAGHNGVQNIIDQLATQKFKRIRIGIKPAEPPHDTADFVMKDFSKEEKEIVGKVFWEVAKEIKSILAK